jgi:chromosome segregation ATPase
LLNIATSFEVKKFILMTSEVFFHTAVAHPKAVTSFRSIVDVDPSLIECPPHFSERETNQALQNLGFAPDDLAKLSRHEASRIPGTDAIRRRVIDELERRRLEVIQSIVTERNRLLQTAEVKPFVAAPDPTTRAMAAAEKRCVKRKKQVLESLITEQTLRKQLRQKEQQRAANQASDTAEAEKLLQTRPKQLQTLLGEQRRQNMIKFQERIERVRRDEEEQQRQRAERLQTQLEKAEQRVAENRQTRDQQMRDRRAKEQAQLERVKTRMSAAQEEVKRLERELRMKQEKVEQCAKELRKMRDSKLQERAAEAYLKQRLVGAKTRQMEQIRQNKVARDAERIDAKTAGLLEQRRILRQREKKVHHDVLKQELDDRAQLERMRAMISKNPDIDSQAVAREFHIV